MPEKQNIEYKLNWHEDYLKWICGFSNAQGGIIYIGKDDHGNVVGIDGYKRLMDDLPNIVRNAMGISVEVNLHVENEKYFIEIIVNPSSVAISLRGRYYYRSGSTKQELTGLALNEFLLKKSGKTWDDVIETRASLSDIDEKSVQFFLSAAKKAGRLPETDGNSTEVLLEKLRLTEGGQIKRAAIILFGKDPGKFYPNTFVKIGRFQKNDADLLFQEVEEGNLIVLLNAVLNQLSHKFLVKNISFEGMNRIEQSEYPTQALREMILNALVHRNYLGAPIQIRVYDDKISIWNEGVLPEGITIDSLKQTHASKPRNPVIADVCFKGGFIDAWGRGTIKIIEACKEANLPDPELKERDGGFVVSLYKNVITAASLKKKGLNERQIKAILYVSENGKISNAEYQTLFDVSKATATRDLVELSERFNLLEKIGITGSGTFYIQNSSNGLTNGSMGS